MLKRRWILLGSLCLVLPGLGVGVWVVVGNHGAAKVSLESRPAAAEGVLPNSGPKNVTFSPTPATYNPTPLAAVSPDAPAALTECDLSAFFGADYDSITAELGPVWDCGRFERGTQWMVLFGGEQPGSTPSGSQKAPFGSYSIALENCAAGDSACLDPAAPHDFSNFVVYRPPSASGFDHPPTTLTIHSSDYIVILDGACNYVVFDLDHPGWFTPPTDPSQHSDLLAGNTNSIAEYTQASNPLTGTEALQATSVPSNFNTCPTPG
jgi:hypothetical protein